MILIGFAFAWWAFFIAFNIFKSAKSFLPCIITAIITFVLSLLIFTFSWDIVGYIMVGLFALLTVIILISKNLK